MDAEIAKAPLFDAHCHLQDELLLPYRDEALRQAEAAGVTAFACCGTSEADWEAVRQLAAARTNIHPAFGLHPWYVRERSESWYQRLAQLIEKTGAGVGECGMDHALEDRSDDEQAEVFRAQLELAREMNRPVTVHCRRAWGALLDVLQPFGRMPAGILIHSYSGDREIVPALSKHNTYFSFSGTITRSGNKRGRRALLEVPEDRLLIETDTPDLMPVVPADAMPYGERVNVPANLVHVFKCVAELRGWTEEHARAVLWENSRRFFQTEPRTGSEEAPQ